MKKFICTVCGYVYTGDAAPEKDVYKRQGFFIAPLCLAIKKTKPRLPHPAADEIWSCLHYQ